jgi:hypothetical protein
VERLNRALKEFLPTTSKAELLNDHIHQFIYFYRLKHLTVGEIFKQFISDIKLVYPGIGKTGLKRFRSALRTPHLHEGFIS